MKKDVYRVIFNKLAAKESKPFVNYLVSQFGFTKKKILFLLKSSPSILCESTSKSYTNSVLKNMKALNANVSVKRLVKDDRLPFLIDELQLKWISKLLNMTIRAGRDSSLLYVDVRPESANVNLNSFLGEEERLEAFFRESDFVYILDDTKLLIFGFTTDTAGLQILIPKVAKIVSDITGGDPQIQIGEAVFPEDGYSFYELVQVIEKRIRTYTGDEETVQHQAGQPDKSKDLKIVQSFSVKENFYISLFSGASGTFYQKLIDLDLELLWFGIRNLPIAEQRRFCQRLPYNSQLANILSGRIKAQAPVKNKLQVKKKFDRLFSNVDLEKRQIEHKKKQSNIIAKLNRLESFSTIQAVAVQVYNLAMDPDSEIDDIQKIIQLDQVMTLKLLKLVNSSFYGLSQKVTSVKDAAIILGLDEIVNMAFSLSLSESFKSSQFKGLLDPEELWKHSIETALIGQHLCREKENFLNQGIFAACILHDFGKLFLINHFPEEYREIIRLSEESQISLYDLEEEAFGYNHGMIGGILSKKWNLPESLTQAISYHHHPSLSTTGYSGLAAITGFADFLCNNMETEDSSGLLQPFLLKDHMENLQLIFGDFTVQTIGEMMEDTKELLKEKSDIFSIFL